MSFSKKSFFLAYYYADDRICFDRLLAFAEKSLLPNISPVHFLNMVSDRYWWILSLEISVTAGIGNIV